MTGSALSWRIVLSRCDVITVEVVLKVISVGTPTIRHIHVKSGTWSILYYQLHVSASTLAIIRLALNLSSDYTICMVCSGEGEARSRFTVAGSMKIRTWDGVTNI